MYCGYYQFNVCERLTCHVLSLGRLCPEGLFCRAASRPLAHVRSSHPADPALTCPRMYRAWGACPVRVRSPRLSALVWRRDLATPAPWTGRPRASDLPYLKVDIARPSRECISREVAYRGRAPGDQGGSLLSDVQYRICMLSSGATRVLKVRTRMISGSDAPVGDSVWSGERACVHPRRINQITFKSFDEHVSGTT